MEVRVNSSIADTPRMVVGHASPQSQTMEIVGEGRVISEVHDLIEVLRGEPTELVVVYLSRARRVIELLAAERRRDEGLLEALAPQELPTPARLLQLRRNAAARNRLIEEFGLYTTAELAELRQADTENPSSVPARWLRDLRIFAVPAIGDRRFPGFQFDGSGRPIPSVRDVIQALASTLGGWELALWFTGPNSTLDGSRPIDLLATQPTDVLAAARHEVEAAGSW